MKALRVVDGAPTLVEDDLVLRDNDVRVKVAAAGICGSDLHLLDAGFVEAQLGELSRSTDLSRYLL